MAYSRYYATETATSGSNPALVHTIANPDNASFGYLAPAHIQLSISTANQSLADFQAASKSVLSINNDYLLDGDGKITTIPSSLTLTAGATYRIYINRVTPKLTHTVDFQAGSPLTESDLDNSNRFSLFRSQEIEDDLGSTSFALTLAAMKETAGITGNFLGTTDAQSVENKTFAPLKGNTFDCGGRSYTAE